MLLPGRGRERRKVGREMNKESKVWWSVAGRGGTLASRTGLGEDLVS